MGYENENTEIIDIFEDISQTEQKTEKQQVKQTPKQVLKNQRNKLLSTSIILIPVFSLIYIISKHSNELINERISIFSLIMIVILSFSLILGIIKEFKIKRNYLTRIFKFSLTAIYISIFAITSFALYGTDKLKYFLVEKAMSTESHHFIATWFYDNKTITDTLNILKNDTKIDIDNSNKLNFDEIKELDTIYANKYEEEILSNKESPYKKIELKNENYNGYIIVVYDLSKVQLMTEKKDSIIVEDVIENEEIEISEPIEIPEEIEVPKTKNLISFKDNKLVLENKELENENYIEYKEIIMENGSMLNKNNKYNKEIIIGQREDDIVLILVLENDNLVNEDVIKILENYSVKNAVVSSNSNKLELSETSIVVKYYEEN